MVGASVGTGLSPLWRGVCVNASTRYQPGEVVSESLEEAEEMARLMQSSTQAFGDAGRIYYSKEMELEADALSAHIVHEAGYDLSAAKGFLVRAHRIAAAVGPQRARAAVGFLSTHPSDEKRIAHWGIVAGKARAGLTPRM